ncbi:ATP-grasp domain-containing protein [Comamonas thiooxydans]|uniref:ATP-grasp domain-containing protein n=1 Tax=Comamonas thiooxydans TaxID=363952 RepID=UPI0009B7FF4F
MSISELIVECSLLERGCREEAAAMTHAAALGLPVTLASRRQVRAIALTASTLCVGSISFLRAALEGRGGLPRHEPYPDPLGKYLHRKTGYSRSLSALVREREMPVFVKPAEGWKRFTGAVLDHEGAARERGISPHQAFFWSSPVTWLSEWRAYCVHGVVLDLQPVPTTSVKSPCVDRDVVGEAAARHYAEVGASGVVLDFGVLESGETALIEANDGFSFGAYGAVAPATLWAVWSARWPQLFENRRIS